VTNKASYDDEQEEFPKEKFFMEEGAVLSRLVLG
jgi:hypothetical protein